MQIELTDKEIKELGYLRRCLTSKMIPVEKLESFLNGLQQKAIAPAAPKPRTTKRELRTDRFRMKIFHGGHSKKAV